jgi:AcrR family transcriptional regulator
MTPRRAAALLKAGGDPQADLRDHLVAMTGRLLDEVPLVSLTTRQIARHAGVSDGVLYNHFADKDELVVASVTMRYTELLDGFEAHAPVVGEATVEANLLAYVRALSALMSDTLQLGAGLFADPELLTRFWTEIHRAPLGPDRLMQPLTSYLEGERAAGRIAASLDVGAATTLVFGACAMTAFARHLNSGAHGSRLDAHLEALIATLLRGLEP